MRSLAITSLVLGIFSFFFGWIPVVGIALSGLGVLLGSIGLVLSIVRRRSEIGYLIVGISISAVALIVGVGTWFEYSVMTKKSETSLQDIQADTQEMNVERESHGVSQHCGLPRFKHHDASADSPQTQQRLRMVERQLRKRDITDCSVLDAMSRVPRHLFVPVPKRVFAYEDHPLSIGYDQTISQPYIVALMTQLAQPKPKFRALDIGTGCGYQAAVLAELVDKVYSIEIVPSLADEARGRLKTLGYNNVEVRCGDGYRGWPEHTPFDVIIVAAAPDHIPQPLIDQLAPGGRLVIPVGRDFQNLMVVEKKPDGSIQKRSVIPVRFVPMTGQAASKK